MDVVILVVTAVVVVAIALAVVGGATRRLEGVAAPAVLEVDDAVSWIADRVPDEVAARLSEADVRRIVGWHLDHFAAVGLASANRAELVPSEEGEDPVVAELDAATDDIVARALAEGDAIESVDVVVVLDLHVQYLRHIGAIGPAVEGGADDVSPAED